MKLLLVLAFFIAAVGATIDWETVVPMNVDHLIPSVPEEPIEEGRIVNGDLARPKQFPYQAGLLLHLRNGAVWCGGTLISNQWILTAAHCTDSIVSIEVYLGAVDRTNRNEQGQQIIRVDKKNVIVHEHWNPNTVQNDISLIKLPYPVVFNDYIQPAKLPKMNSNRNYSGLTAIASGWGRISDSAASSTDKLRWAVVPIMENYVCSFYFIGSVHDTNICINTMEGKSTCNGDSGGPLVLADGTNTVIGATSFGSKLGCEKGWPGVFTRITSYLSWIATNSGVANY